MARFTTFGSFERKPLSFRQSWIKWLNSQLHILPKFARFCSIFMAYGLKWKPLTFSKSWIKRLNFYRSVRNFFVYLTLLNSQLHILPKFARSCSIFMAYGLKWKPFTFSKSWIKQLNFYRSVRNFFVFLTSLNSQLHILPKFVRFCSIFMAYGLKWNPLTFSKSWIKRLNFYRSVRNFFLYLTSFNSQLHILLKFAQFSSIFMAYGLKWKPLTFSKS